jgi:hypothetical protein
MRLCIRLRYAEGQHIEQGVQAIDVSRRRGPLRRPGEPETELGSRARIGSVRRFPGHPSVGWCRKPRDQRVRRVGRVPLLRAWLRAPSR